MGKAIGWLEQGNLNHYVGNPFQTNTGRAQGKALVLAHGSLDQGAMPTWHIDFCTASLLVQFAELPEWNR
jgi:hypothetical protein